MKALVVLLIVLLVAASTGFAGEIFGTISEGGKAVGAGVKVTITAGDKSYATETDKFGAYRVFVKEKGKCTITVKSGEDAPSAELFSYDKSTRYDWVLESKEGKPTLRRK